MQSDTGLSGLSAIVSGLTSLGNISRIQFSSNQQLTPGAVLAYEYTQAWTMAAMVQTSSLPAVAAIIFTNALSAPYPCYEVWLLPSGNVTCLLIHNDTTAYIQVSTTNCNVADGVEHYIAVTYDGSGAASGVNIYVDGVAISKTTVSDNLGGASIVSAGNFIIGNQTNFETQYLLNGTIREFSMSNIARSSGWVSSYSTVNPPAVDANTVLCYHCTEGKGTSVADSSANGYTGTITSSSQWQNVAIPAGPYTTITHIAGVTQANSGGSTTTTAAINTTGANLLVACVTNSKNNFAAPTDSFSNTWIPLCTVLPPRNATFRSALYYCFPPSNKVGSGHTFSISGSNADIAVESFAGVSTGGYDQQISFGTAASNSAQPGSITPAIGGAVVIFAGGFYDGTALSAVTGFTMRSAHGGSGFGTFIGYQIQTTVTAVNPTATQTGNSVDTWVLTSLADFFPA